MCRIVRYGGTVDVFEHNTNNRCHVETIREFDWVQDAYSYATEALVGDVLERCLDECLVEHYEHCPVTVYTHRQDINNRESQMVIPVKTTNPVRIYHKGNDAFVAVKMNRGQMVHIARLQEQYTSTFKPSAEEVFVPNEHGNRPMNEAMVPSDSFYYFTVVSMGHVVKMLRPTSMEIFEGKIPQFNVGNDENSDKWYQLLSSWTKLDNIGEEFEVSSLRTRQLLLSKLGNVNGYHCRLEIFEECFGEVLILIHGVVPNKILKLRFTRHMLQSLLHVCDEHEEKEQLEAVDIHALAAICSGTCATAD